MRHDIMRGKRFLALTLTVFMILGVAACGQNFNATPSKQNSSASNRLTGIGATPESGIDERPVVYPNGHLESLMSSSGILYVGSDNGTLYAFRVSDGTLLWQNEIGGLVSIYAVTGGTVYAVAGSNYDVVYAFNASSGTPLWHHQIDSSIFGVVVVNGVVYVNTNSSGANGAAVYALQATNGALLWHYTADIDIPASLSVMDGIVYLPASGRRDSSTYIYALQASSGHFLWRLSLEEPPVGQPLAANGIVYIISGYGTVYALHENTGASLWRFTRFTGSSPVDAAPTLVNGVLYISTVNSFYALRISDASLLWVYPKSSSSGFPDMGQPVVVDGTVYAGDVNGSLYALRASNGTLLWQQNVGNAVFGPLTVEDGLVYVSTQLNYDYALRTTDGKLAWRHPTSSFETLLAQNPPQIVANGVVSTAGTDGVVNALRAKDGTLLWSYKIKEQAVPPDPVYSAQVTFTSSVSYIQALRIVTDLGLQTFVPCAWSAWKPEGNPGNFPGMLVSSTPIGAPLWLNRLKATPGVQSVESNPVYHCPAATGASTSTNTFLPANKTGTYVRVTFGSQLNGYDAALNAINDLGFRLADPCYERARASGTKPTWKTMGQESSFGTTHTLVLATTNFNSIQWANQLRTLTGVVKVETPFTATC